MRSLCAGATRAKTDTLAGDCPELLVVEPVELGAGDGGGVRPDDAEVRRDPAGGHRVVAGDHDGADAGSMRLVDRHGRLRARRVDDADEAEVDEVALGGLVEVPGISRPSTSIER